MVNMPGVLLNCPVYKRLADFVRTLFDEARRARMVTLSLLHKPNQPTTGHRSLFGALATGNAALMKDRLRAHRQRTAGEPARLLDNSRLARL